MDGLISWLLLVRRLQEQRWRLWCQEESAFRRLSEQRKRCLIAIFQGWLRSSTDNVEKLVEQTNLLDWAWGLIGLDNMLLVRIRLIILNMRIINIMILCLWILHCNNRISSHFKILLFVLIIYSISPSFTSMHSTKNFSFKPSDREQIRHILRLRHPSAKQ